MEKVVEGEVEISGHFVDFVVFLFQTLSVFKGFSLFLNTAFKGFNVSPIMKTPTAVFQK